MGGGASKTGESHATASSSANSGPKESNEDEKEPSNAPHSFAVASREIGNDGLDVVVGRRASIQHSKRRRAQALSLVHTWRYAR